VLSPIARLSNELSVRTTDSNVSGATAGAQEAAICRAAASERTLMPTAETGA